jgi:multiple RNA-binding domain-containing protein 1
VRDFKTSTSKGLAYVQFAEAQAAEAALRGLDGKSFQGRLLHILPALDKKSSKLDEFELSKLPLKTQKSLRRKAEALTSTFSWNSLYMNADAVLSSVADRLGVEKAELLDPTSSDAAVKQAFAETDVIQKTKDHLRESGVNIDAFKSRERDDRILLFKNFPYGTTSEELRALVDPFGSVTKFILPPSGTMAIVQFSENHAALQALRQLAYKNFKGSVLFLEKGPQGLFKDSSSGTQSVQNDRLTGTDSGSLAVDQSHSQADVVSSTLFIRNLNFSTTTARLAEIFQPLKGFLSAQVKTRTDPKRPNEILSMGFGFVEFATNAQAQSAIAAMNGYRLDGHELQVRESHRTTDVAEERRRKDKAKKTEGQKTKIIIKNLPFEASKKDIRALFGTYGQLRTVRVPKKFDNSTRGFAFAEFVTAKEAQNAIEALANTHLLGRRLVLDFAEGEIVDPEDEIQAIERKVGQQASMIHLNKITGSARRKFNVDAREDVDPA